MCMCVYAIAFGAGIKKGALLDHTEMMCDADQMMRRCESI